MTVLKEPPDNTDMDEDDDGDKAAGGSQINSPEIGIDGKPTQRAVSTARQAHAIAKWLRDRARDRQGGRIWTAATIAAKYNGEPPFRESDLSATGQAWRNNFSTNFLASIIDRVKPQMLDPVNKADVLTHSMLSSKVEDAANKSRIFCEVTTRVIRRWPEWRDFTSQLAQENVLYGLATPGWIDSHTEWRPRLWRYDETYLPEGTGQHASKVQIAVFTQKVLIHEFISLFRDRKIAEKACYNVDNCIRVANNFRDQRDTDETELEKVDTVREGGQYSDSYNDKANTIDLYHVVVCDFTGEVDLWTVTANNGTEIRCVENLHDEMQDALTLFTFQSGNSKLYGSKGLGRLLTNLHIAIERGRCLGADQMYLSGLVIFKSNKKDAASLQARVRHPFIFVSDDMNVVTEQIQFNVQAFEMMDAKLTQLAESIAGAFIPPNLNQEGANTKIEAAQNAERELAVKEGVLGRFFDHLADLVSAMQRKIYSPINLREGKRAYDRKVQVQQNGVTVLMRRVWKLLQSAFGSENKTMPDLPESGVGDEEAVSAVMELLENGLTVEDIATLAQSPSAQSNATDGTAKDQATLQFIAGNVVNPFIDQRKATEMAASIAIGQDRSKQLIIPTDDPQVETIATRQQLMELGDMVDGTPMPVAASDKHDTHRKVLAQKISSIIAAIQQAPTDALITTAELVLTHYGQHLQLDTMMPPDQKATETKALVEDMTMVQKIKQAAAQQAAANAAMPVPVNGQPPQVGPDGQVVGEDPNARQSIHPDDAKLKLEVHKAGQEDQRIALAQDQHGLAKDQHELEKAKVAHQQQVDALKLQQTNAQMLQTAAQDTQASGEKQADRDLDMVIAENAQKALPTGGK